MYFFDFSPEISFFQRYFNCFLTILKKNDEFQNCHINGYSVLLHSVAVTVIELLLQFLLTIRRTGAVVRGGTRVLVRNSLPISSHVVDHIPVRELHI